MEYLKQKFERYIKSVDDLLIQLFIDANEKNLNGINIFLSQYRDTIEGMIATFEALDFSDKKGLDDLLDRYAQVWESLFVDGHKIYIPYHAQSALLSCLRKDVDTARKILDMDKERESIIFLLQQFKKGAIDETFKYVSELSKELGEEHAHDLIMNKMLGDSAYIFQLIEGIAIPERETWVVNLYLNYQMNNPLDSYMKGKPVTDNENNYLDFIQQNVALNDKLRLVYENWENPKDKVLIRTNQSMAQIRAHFESFLLEWYNSGEVENFFNANFACFKKPGLVVPIKSFKSKTEQKGLNTRLRRLVYAFWFKEGLGVESQNRYAILLKENFEIFANTKLKTITDNFSR